MDTKLARDVRFLKAYALFATLLWIATVAVALAPEDGKPKFGEIDVERINIVERDGQLRLVISNRERQHPGIVDGKLMPRPGGRPPGMLFFDHLGNECGGLIFDENGGQGHFVSLTMDKSRQDQTIGMQHLESDNGQYFAGLRIWDRPHTSLADAVEKFEAVRAMEEGPERDAAIEALRAAGEFGAERLTMAKLRDTSAVLSMADTDGNTRIRLSVDPQGNPKLEFLNANGEVVLQLPEVKD